MRVYLEESVREMAEERINYIFDHFDRVGVNVSGGKDSTVVFEMAYKIAQERGRDLYCMWIDQEAEYQSTVETVREWMYRDGVVPVWCQVPMKMTNATSDEADFLDCWNEDKADQWVHDKDPIAIHENTFGTQRFRELFDEILWQHVAEEDPELDVAMFGGVRAEESPNRYLGMTMHEVFNGITYGKSSDYDNVVTIYPIYDWSYSDVWKYIHDNDIDYNDVYDAQYSRGIPVRDMRVSNLNHETAVRHLFTLQEFEPETWNAMDERLDGVHMASQMGFANYVPEELPYMFTGWREYRNYLLQHVVEDEEHRKHFKREFFTQDLMCEHLSDSMKQSVYRGHVRGILTNDWEGETVLSNTKRKISYPSTTELMQIKKERLKEDKPEVWNELYEQGIVQRPAEVES